MQDDATRFRKRASECRELAAKVEDEEWRGWLIGLAEDLESEATREDAEDSA